MQSFLQKNWFILAITFVLILVIGVVGYRLWIEPTSIDERLTVIKKAPDFELTNIQEKTVKMNELDGKVRLVYFFYSSCPDVCLPTTFFLSKVQNALQEKGVFGDKSMILSISVDPTRDRMEVLRKYAAQFQADANGWMFLLGDEEKVKKLAEEYGIMIIKDKDGNFTHSNSILLIDREGNLRNYYDASNEKLTPEYIVNDIVKLSKM